MSVAHQEVLKELCCDDLSTLIDPAFLQRFGLESPGQYGVVTADVPMAMRRLEALGASVFVHAHVAMPGWMERGKARDGVFVEMALGYTNHQQIELLGPGRNTQLYAEKIPTDGGLALHHVCVYHHGIEDLERRLNSAGFPTVLAGDLGRPNIFTTRYRYFDTRDELGFYLEVCEFLLFKRQISFSESLIRFAGRVQKLLGSRESQGNQSGTAA